MTGGGPRRAPALDDATRLKRAFRRHAAGVALVTAVTESGPVGLTASSVASVAADPPVLSFSVGLGRRTAEALVVADRLDVHLLPASRAALADAFARPGAPRFTSEQGWEWRDGVPSLPDALATLTCSVRATVPVGPSVLVLADVHAVHLGPSAEPLLHHDRTFRGLGRVLPAHADGASAEA